MVVKHSPLTEFYRAFRDVLVEVPSGVLSVEKLLFLWINDGRMAIFLVLVGLETRHELLKNRGWILDKSLQK